MTPTSVFRNRMEISFGSFLRLIRRETEPRGRAAGSQTSERGKQKGRNTRAGVMRRTRTSCRWKGGRGEGDRRGLQRGGQDWEAKCRRPNNGQAASTDLPAPGPHEASTCFPSAARANIGPSICPLRSANAIVLSELSMTRLLRDA